MTTAATVAGSQAVTSAINRYYDPTTGQFTSMDPLVIVTGQAYSYTAGNPVNEIDPLGLHGCGIFSGICDHWRGIVTGVGIAAGVAAAFTGVGAIAEGSVALGFISAGAGIASGLADVPACIGVSGRGSGLACVGVGFGVGAGLLGGVGALAGYAVDAGATVANGAFDIYGGLAGTLGFAAGTGAIAFDGILGENGYLTKTALCAL